MHKSSLVYMKKFIDKYLDKNKKLSILDVGSRSFGKDKTYKHLCDNPNWTYTGLDIESGVNVDIVAKSSYCWQLNKEYDVVISGQCMEHVKCLNLWVLEIVKALKPNGLVCIIVPMVFRKHFRYDYWRILPDGMKYLLGEVGGLKLLDVYNKKFDCVGIAKKVRD